MIKQMFILSTIILCFGCKNTTTSKPYEATWLELTKTDNGYVVYNYESMEDVDVFVGPNSLTIKGDSLIDKNYMDGSYLMIFDEVQRNESDSSYLFPIGNYYRFMWANEEKHIARWIIYYGNEPEMRVMFDLLFVDSLYNTYPIVDYKWDSTPPVYQ